MRLDRPDDAAGEHDPETEQWSRAEHLMASVIESIRVLTQRYEQVNFNNGGRNFEPVPRPGISSGEQQRALTAEETDFLYEYLKAMGD